MKINFTHKFHKILILPLNKFNYSQTNYLLNQLIPLEWQLVLINDGSFTQNLNSLTGKNIKIEIISIFENKILNQHNYTREIWLKDHNCNRLAFAQSLWPIYNNTKYLKLPNNQPVGQSLIELQIDIYKDIHEIYYGYSQYLEKEFHIEGPTWGRKYTLYYKNNPLATIQEIFSPQIINLFTQS